MFTGERQDRYNDQVFHPPCMFETRLLGLSEDLKTFQYAEIDASEMIGLIDVQVFAAGRKGNYHMIMDKKIVASPGSVNANIASLATTQVTENVPEGSTSIPVKSTFGFLDAPNRININGMMIEYAEIDGNNFVVENSPQIEIGSQVTQPQFTYPDPATIFTSYTPQKRMLKTEKWDTRDEECSSCGVESKFNDNIDRGFSLLIKWRGRLAINGIKMHTTPYPGKDSGDCEEDEELARSLDQAGCGTESEIIIEQPTIDSAALHSQYLRSITHRPYDEEAYNPLPS
jgi:hypothetical protein